MSTNIVSVYVTYNYITWDCNAFRIVPLAAVDSVDKLIEFGESKPKKCSGNAHTIRSLLDDAVESRSE